MPEIHTLPTQSSLDPGNWMVFDTGNGETEGLTGAITVGDLRTVLIAGLLNGSEGYVARAVAADDVEEATYASYAAGDMSQNLLAGLFDQSTGYVAKAAHADAAAGATYVDGNPSYGLVSLFTGAGGYVAQAKYAESTGNVAHADTRFQSYWRTSRDLIGDSMRRMRFPSENPQRSVLYPGTRN